MNERMNEITCFLLCKRRDTHLIVSGCKEVKSLGVPGPSHCRTCRKGHASLLCQAPRDLGEVVTLPLQEGKRAGTAAIQQLHLPCPRLKLLLHHDSYIQSGKRTSQTGPFSFHSSARKRKKERDKTDSTSVWPRPGFPSC